MKKDPFGYNQKQFWTSVSDRLRQRTIKEVLVQWKDMTLVDATWEPATIL
jgi:hypothetical protein